MSVLPPWPASVAFVWPRWYSRFVISLNAFRPEPLNVRSTTGWPLCGSKSACAFVSCLPVIAGGSLTRYQPGTHFVGSLQTIASVFGGAVSTCVSAVVCPWCGSCFSCGTGPAISVCVTTVFVFGFGAFFFVVEPFALLNRLAADETFTVFVFVRKR